MLAFRPVARHRTVLPVLAGAMVLVLSLAGCVRPRLSEGAPRHPGNGVAWLITRHLSQGFSLRGEPVETLATSGRYLIDGLLVPESGEAYAQIGPVLTVRDLATGRIVWQLAAISGFPVVTRNALYIGRRGYDLASGKQFRIPVGVPAGSIPDPSGDGILAFTGSPAGRILVDMNPKTGVTRWRTSAQHASRFCGNVAVGRSAVIAMRCAATGSGRGVRVEVDCFDPATGRPRWSRLFQKAWSPAGLRAAVNGSTVMVVQDLTGDAWSMTVDAMTGEVLPGLVRARAWMRAKGSPVVGLGPDRTAIVATRDETTQAARANRSGIRALRLIDLAHGRVLWTVRLTSSAGRDASLGFTRRAVYLLSGSRLTAYSLQTGRGQGQTSLPVTFRINWRDPFDVLIPGPVSRGAGVIVGPERGPLLTGDLLISELEEGGLAAVQTSAPSG